MMSIDKANAPPFRYSITIEWDPIDSIYIATVPELRGCRTHGATYEDAVAMVQDAMRAWLDGHDAQRIPVPRLFDLESTPWRNSPRDVAPVASMSFADESASVNETGA